MTVVQYLAAFSLLFGFAVSARAAAPEGCWQEANNPRVVDGLFVAYVDATSLSKDALLATMASFNGNISLEPTRYPLVDDGTLEVELSARFQQGETRADVISRVNARVHELQAQPGVEIDCELTLVPGPAVSGSN